MPALDSRYPAPAFLDDGPGAPAGVMRMSAEKENPVAGERAQLLEGRMLRFLARRGDFVLAAVIIAVIGLLVIPLPTPIIDGLIATNLAASLALLMLSMYVPSSLGLS